MALLLCDGVGKACNGLCKGLCEVINLPCKLCCRGCEFSCDVLCRAVTSAFFPYLAVTCGFNLPPTIWGIRSVAVQCDQSSWLGINAIGTAIHILAAFYIVYKIQAEYSDSDSAIPVAVATPVATPVSKSSMYQVMTGTTDPEKGSTTPYQKIRDSIKVPSASSPPSSTTAMTTGGRGGGNRRSSSSEPTANSWSRMCQILSYDAGVAIYLVVFVMWLCWQSVGISRVLTDNFADSDCEGWMTNSVIMGWIFMMLLGVSFCCSLICLRPV